VQEDVEEGTVDAQVAIVVDEAQLAELIQKKTHPGPRRANHLGQRLLTDLRNHRLGVEHPEHRGLLNAHQGAVGERRGRGHAQRLPGQTALAKKRLGREERDHRFLALGRDNGELHLSLLDIEHRVGRLALRKDRVLLLAGHERSASADFSKERLRIERVRVCHPYPLSRGGGAMSRLLF
jgi:hypothetical protein